MNTKLDMTLHELWKHQGKSVTGWSLEDGWYIFIHVRSTKHPNSGFAQKWHFVVTTDNLYCGINDFIDEERVPKCFSSKKNAEWYWGHYGETILRKISEYEEYPWAAEFDKFEVNICRASVRFGITTDDEDLRTKETLVTVNQVLLDENEKLRQALKEAVEYERIDNDCKKRRRSCGSCDFWYCPAKKWAKLIKECTGKK